MLAMSGTLLVCVSLAAIPEKPYNDAARSSEATGKPLVVLLGADWCPGCVTMKNRVLPEVAKDGSLDQVEFAYVDIDKQPELARNLSQANSIPQLIRFERKSEEQWERQQLTGAQSVERVRSFLRGPAPSRPVAAAQPNLWRTVSQWLAGP